MEERITHRLNGNRQLHRSSPRDRSSVSGALHGLTELAELQLQLFSADLKAARRRVAMPMLAVAVGICLGIGVAPVAWIAFAELLLMYTELTRLHAYLTSFVVGGAAAGALLAAGWFGIRSSTSELRKSYMEMTQNIACLRGVLAPSRDSSQQA